MLFFSSGFRILSTFMQTNPQSKQKKISLSRTEAYAMQQARPVARSRWPGLLVAVLLIAAAATALWYWQDQWRPLLFPVPETPEENGAAAEPADETPPAPIIHSLADVTYLSAAGWDNAEFRRAVVSFNEAYDIYLPSRAAHVPMAALAQAEQLVITAARQFAALQAEVPPHIPLADYLTACRLLLDELRRLAQDPRTAPPPSQAHLAAHARAATDTPAQPTDAPSAATPAPWQNADYAEGARLFNQALAQYNQFLADKSQTGLLKSIEELAFQSAKKFEAVRDAAPSHIPIADHITQSYKLISDVRRQNLELDTQGSTTVHQLKRGTTGPKRRPALPAYQAP